MNKKEILITEILKSRKNVENMNLTKIKNVVMECFNSLTVYMNKITNIQEEKEKINIVEDQLFLLNKYIKIYNLANSVSKGEKTLQKIKNCILICRNTINCELKKIA